MTSYRSTFVMLLAGLMVSFNVADTLNLLLPIAVDKRFISGIEGGQSIVPCLPSAPDVELTLRNDKGKDMLTDSRVTFSPAIGFTLHNLTLADQMGYVCEGRREGLLSTATAFLHVEMRAKPFSSPRLSLVTDNPQSRVVSGATFSLNCSVQVQGGVTFLLTWQPPGNVSEQQQEGRVQHFETVTSEVGGVGPSLVTAHRVLTVLHAGPQDAGTYLCTVRAGHDHQSAAVRITVHK